MVIGRAMMRSLSTLNGHTGEFCIPNEDAKDF